jgi:hypothetical protein
MAPGTTPTSSSNEVFANQGLSHTAARIDRVVPGIRSSAFADRHVRLDPYDPSTFRLAGQCEHRSTSDPAFLRAILKVRDGAGGGYWWVECGTCECGWQVPHYAVA